MRYTKTEERLMGAMAEMDIIDCHEHLPPEKSRTETPQDVFTLFSHYTRHDLFSAGMDQKEYERLFDYDLPIEKRWARFRPYYDAIRYGSYARAALLTAKMVYGFDDINDDTYKPLSDKIAAENTPGIYHRILCERCRIRASLTQCGSTQVGAPLVPVMPGRNLTQLRKKEQLDELTATFGPAATLDEYLAVARKQLQQWIAEGAVGIKLVSQPNVPPDGGAAEAAFARLLAGEELSPAGGQPEPLDNYLTHKLMDLAGELNLVVAVHSGIWGDFRSLDCKHMLSFAPAHPNTKFDLYHLGMPMVRDTIVVAKNYANVYLNLCWTHIISQEQTCSGIGELLDQVPVNKVLAFGGDYGRPVEKVVGHLHMAREDYARVFGARIDAGLMSHDDALHILKMWFWDNPLRLYDRLDVAKQ